MTLIVAGERKSFDWIAGIDAYHDEVRSARREENLGDGTIAVVPARYPDGATVTQAALFGNIHGAEVIASRGAADRQQWKRRNGF